MDGSVASPEEGEIETPATGPQGASGKADGGAFAAFVHVPADKRWATDSGGVGHAVLEAGSREKAEEVEANLLP